MHTLTLFYKPVRLDKVALQKNQEVSEGVLNV
jgi:hypothetical protein